MPAIYAPRARFIPAPRWDWDSLFAGVEGATASGFFSAASATGSGLAGAASFLSLFFVRLRGMVNDYGGISVVDVRWRTRGHGEGTCTERMG